MYSVGRMSERREKARGSFCSLQVQGSCSVEERWWFGESDDQYLACDLGTGKLEAASGAKQGFERDGLGSFRRVGAKMFIWLQSGEVEGRMSEASDGRRWMAFGASVESWMWYLGERGGGNLVWSLIFFWF